MKIADLVWSEITQPNPEMNYTHVYTKTVFGKIYITFNSWKEIPDYYIEFPLDWNSNHIPPQPFVDHLEEAKEFANKCWKSLIQEYLEQE